MKRLTSGNYMNQPSSLLGCKHTTDKNCKAGTWFSYAGMHTHVIGNTIFTADMFGERLGRLAIGE